MTIKNQPKGHLSVVKSRTSSAVILTPEQLAPDQLVSVKEYLRISETKGVMVGALVGEGGWNIRPLSLEQGFLKIVRVSDPSLALDQKRFLALKQLSSRVAPISSVSEQSGEAAQMLWMRRNFMQRVLSEWDEFTEAKLGLHPVSLARQLILAVREWLKNSLVHGHLCASNIALEGQTVSVLDFGFAAYSRDCVRNGSGFAPELERGQAPLAATDIYGLALVLKPLLGNLLNSRQKDLIEKMLADDPIARPDIGQVVDCFSLPRDASENVNPKPVQESELRLGKVLGKHVAVMPTAGALPEKAAAVSKEPLLTHSNERGSKWLKGTVAFSPEMMDRIRKSIDTETGPEKKESGISERKVVKAEPTKSEPPRVSSKRGWIVLAVLLLGVSAFIGYQRNFFSAKQAVEVSNPVLPGPSNLPFDEYWESGLPSKMKQVAEAAVIKADPKAELVIVRDIVVRKQDRPKVHGLFLRLAFDQRWEQALKPADRQVALQIGLRELLSGSSLASPALDQLHEGILLAVMTELPLEDDGAPLKELALAKLTALPAPLGPPFLALGDLGVKVCSDRSARALARIVSGTINLESLSAFFTQTDDSALAKGKLKLLLGLAGGESLHENTVTAINSNRGALFKLLSWFDETKFSHWSKLSRFAKLTIISGTLPVEQLNLEHLADLLTFPDDQIRTQAKQRLVEDYFPSREHATLELLASAGNQFTRDQTIFLVNTLGLKDEQLHAFTAKWYELQPNTQAVYMLLLSRWGIERDDPISVEGARYLKSQQNWDPSSAELETLAGHPEALVRSLVYNRLDPSKPEERKVLEKMVKVEPSDGLRKFLKLRLGQKL